MSTLDEMFLNEVSDDIEEILSELGNTEAWSKENRDERVTQFVSKLDDAVVKAEGFLKRALDSDTDGKSLIYWVIYKNTLATIYDFFCNIEEALVSHCAQLMTDNGMTFQEAKTAVEGVQPFDFEWVAENKSRVFSELYRLDKKLSMTPTEKVEDV